MGRARMSAGANPADLEQVCPHDGKKIGEHTVAEWFDHLVDQVPHTDLPFEHAPDGPVMVDLGDEQLELVDTIMARATILAGTAGPVDFVTPIAILDLQQGRAGDVPLQVRRVGVIGTPDSMRKLGKLVRDTFYAAANAAER